MTRRWSFALRATPRSRRASEAGQAMVESAIIIPLMVFFILGIIQLAMLHHAKIMTEYAAFNAARAGIVWNADPIIMENAAIISLLPTYEALVDESDLASPERMLKGIMQRALMYQVNRRLEQSVALLREGAGNLISKIDLPSVKVPLAGDVGDKAEKGLKDFLNENRDQVLATAENVAATAAQSAIGGALGGGEDRMVQVQILNPAGGVLAPAVLNTTLGSVPLGGLQQTIGGTFGPHQREIDFDDPGARGATRLTIRVRYLYMMRIPFASWIIHQAWLAGQAGRRLYGAVWNPQQDAPGETGFRDAAEVDLGAPSDALLRKISALADQGTYVVPLEATYSMRMQSNPYKQSLQLTP